MGPDTGFVVFGELDEWFNFGELDEWFNILGAMADRYLAMVIGLFLGNRGMTL